VDGIYTLGHLFKVANRGMHFGKVVQVHVDVGIGYMFLKIRHHSKTAALEREGEIFAVIISIIWGVLVISFAELEIFVFYLVKVFRQKQQENDV